MRAMAMLTTVALAVSSCGGESVIGGGDEQGKVKNGGSGGNGGTGANTSTGSYAGYSGSGALADASGGAYYGIMPDVTCDYTTALLKTCAISSCHKQGSVAPAAGLSLVPDAGLISRIKDVPATHGDIYCPELNDTCPERPPGCPVGDKLIDSAFPEQSWMYRKISGPPDCGEQMPAGVNITADQKACILTLIFTIANLPPL